MRDQVGGYHIGFFPFACRLAWFTIRHLIPRHGYSLLPLLVTVVVSFWFSQEKMAGGWTTLPPLGVLVFGGIGLFAARATASDLLVEELVTQDLLVGRTGTRELGAVHGSIRALEDPLISPLSGIECVAYKYMIGVPNEGESATVTETAYLGYHFVPTEIVGREGSYRLLAFPDLHRFESGSASRKRAREHVAGLTAQPGIPIIDAWLTEDRLRRQTFERFAADFEIRGVHDWTEATVEERALPEGTKACVIGLVDREERVVRPPFPHARHGALVYPGTPQSVIALLRDESGVGTGFAVVFLALALAAFLFPLSPIVALASGGAFLLLLRWPGTVRSLLAKVGRGFRRR